MAGSISMKNWMVSKLLGTLGLKKFWLGKLWAQNMFINFLAELDNFRNIYFVCISKKNGFAFYNFHVKQPETLTEWKFKSITDGRSF